ncbi:MAG: class I SAM-dependent methyltransferase [Pelagibacteraceae bacterium]|jgi:ubiquinone/menaquinone biosynthesis C-methylase UbiE|nr:class I SAM-dependent methyltransferase [Pelagibacteraceae bacterium]
MIDKDVEKYRYDKEAEILLSADKLNQIEKTPKYLNTPYEFYFKFLEGKNSQSKLLEIGAGTGQNTGSLIDMSYKVCATDISLKSVELMKKRFYGCVNFSAQYADMEKLPFNDENFNIVCSAGSLSYGDNKMVMNEIYRVLKPGGMLVVVDSLNNNPIYQFNRYIKYLKGNRTKSTLVRMPTISLIDKYTQKFGHVEVKYFGAITWIFPLLNKVLNEKLMTDFFNWIDATFKIKSSAFKFVMKAVKK